MVIFYDVTRRLLDDRATLVRQGQTPKFTDIRHFFYECRNAFLRENPQLTEIDSTCKKERRKELEKEGRIKPQETRVGIDDVTQSVGGVGIPTPEPDPFDEWFEEDDAATNDDEATEFSDELDLIDWGEEGFDELPIPDEKLVIRTVIEKLTEQLKKLENNGHSDADSKGESHA